MSFKNFFKKYKNPLLISFFFFVFVEGIIIISTNYLKQKDINYYLNIFTSNLKSDITMANTHLTELTQVFYDFDIDSKTIVNIMAQASETKDIKRRAVLRKKLYKILNPQYIKMQRYGIRQLHFHLPGSISFLRFHRPQKFGDSLVKIRETIDYVNKYKIPIAAFEEGRIYNGFRNVYPIFQNNKFVGTVEISFSFDALQDFLIKTDSTSYLFLVKQKVITEKVWGSERKNYMQSQFSGFDFDKKTLSNTMQMRLNKMYAINKTIAAKVSKKLTEGKSFSLYFHHKNIYEDAPIIISFIAIPNLEDKTVAYIINYQFADTLTILIDNAHMIFIAFTLFVLVLSIILLLYLINEQKRRKNIFNHATHDELTGLYNRYAIDYFFGQKIDEAKRYNKPLSIIFCDIDFFKKINDTYGHNIGDFVLKNIATILKNHLRSSDISARWGGEEFIIFLPQTSCKEAAQTAEKLRKIIEDSLFSSIKTLTCSFGVTELKNDENADAFLKRVDRLLYKAKENGRNRVESE